MTTISIAECRPILDSRHMSPSPTKGLRTKVAKIGGLAAANRCRSGDFSVDNIIGLPLLHTEPSLASLRVPYSTPREPEYITPRTSKTHYYQHTADDPSYIDDRKDEPGRPLSVVGEKLDTSVDASLRLPSSVPLLYRRQFYISPSPSSSECSNYEGRNSPDNPPPSPDLKLDGIKMSCQDKRGSKFETRDFTPGFIKKKTFCCDKCEGRMTSHDCLQLDNASPFFSYYRHHSGSQTYGRIPPLLKEYGNIQPGEFKDNYHKGDIVSLPNLPYTTSEKLMSDAVIERFKTKPQRKMLPNSIVRKTYRKESPDYDKEEILLSTCLYSSKISKEKASTFGENTHISKQSRDVGTSEQQTTSFSKIESPIETCNQEAEYNINESVIQTEPMWRNFWPINGSLETTSQIAEPPELSHSPLMEQTPETSENKENDINTQCNSDEDMLIENQCIVPSISVSFQNLPSKAVSKEKQDNDLLDEEVLQEDDEQAAATQQFYKNEFVSRDNKIENRELLQDIIRECAQGLREISHRGFLPEISTRSDFVYEPNTDKRYNRWKRRRKKKSKHNREKHCEISSPDDSSAEEAVNEEDGTERPEYLPRFRRRRREAIEKLFGSEQAMLCYDASSELTSSDRDTNASFGNFLRQIDRGSISDDDLDAFVANMLQNGTLPVLKMMNGKQSLYSEQQTPASKDIDELIKLNQKYTNSSFTKNDRQCVETSTPVPINTDNLRPLKHESMDKVNTDGVMQHESNVKYSKSIGSHSNRSFAYKIGKNSDFRAINTTIAGLNNIPSGYIVGESNDFHTLNTNIGLGSYSEPGPINCASYVQQNILTKGHNSAGSLHNVLSSMESFSGNTMDMDRENLAPLHKEHGNIHTSYNSSQTDNGEFQDTKISCSIAQTTQERKTSGKDDTYHRLEKSLLQLAKQHLQTSQSVSNKKYSDGQLKSKLPNISDSKLTVTQKGNGKQSKNYRNVLNRFVQPLNIDNLNRSRSPYVKDNNTALIKTLRRQRKESMVIKNDKVKREKRLKQQQLLSRRITETTNKVIQEDHMVNSDLSSLTLNHLLQTMPGNKSKVNIKTKKMTLSAEPNQGISKQQIEQELPVLDIKKLNMLAKSYASSESEIDKRRCLAMKNASKTSQYSYKEDQQKPRYNERSLSTLSFSRAFTFSVFELPISYKEKNKQIERRASTALNCRV